jgi:hypothetical protein
MSPRRDSRAAAATSAWERDTGERRLAWAGMAATGQHLPDQGQAARVETSRDARDVLNRDVVNAVRR